MRPREVGTRADAVAVRPAIGRVGNKTTGARKAPQEGGTARTVTEKVQEMAVLQVRHKARLTVLETVRTAAAAFGADEKLPVAPLGET